VAKVVLLDDQVTLLVIVCVLESLNEPVAMNGNWVPAAMERPEGVTEMDEMVASETTSVTEPLTAFSVAEIVDWPGLTAAAVLFWMDATPVLEEAHVTWLVMLRVLPSENVPIAVYWMVVFNAMVLLPGWIAMDERFAAFTVNCVLPLIEFQVAVMVVVPTLRPVTAPLMVTVPTLTLDEFHVETLVMSWVELVVPSRKVPVAVNCFTEPKVSVEFAGVTTIDCNTPLVTVKAAVFEMLPDVAVMVELPCATAVASPWVETPLLMVAAAVLEEVQVTVEVMSLVLLSL
jgi:hypothetical protein